MIDENFCKREYVTNLSPTNARELFKFRAKMFNVKFNYKSDWKNNEELWKCHSCEVAIETQNHILFCPAYASLRENKIIEWDEDLSEYLKKVLLVRERLSIPK